MGRMEHVESMVAHGPMGQLGRMRPMRFFFATKKNLGENLLEQNSLGALRVLKPNDEANLLI